MSAALRFVDITSAIDGVSAIAWRRFVQVLEVHVQTVNKTSKKRDGIGVYAIPPRRLVEIGRATNFRRLDNRQLCDFLPPWTEKRFLSDPVAQYAVLVKSMRLYYDALRRGEIKKPAGVSISGALAVLHLGGKGALESWPNLFDRTKALYQSTKGLF